MSENGWIKLHRKILENPVVMKDPDHYIVWSYLLLNASHKDMSAWFGGEKITLKAGQLITGRKQIAKVTGVNESKVRRIIKDFKIDHQIDQQISSKNSLFTIINWDKYQIIDQQNGQQVTNKWPTSDHKQEYKNNKNKRNNSDSFNNFKGRVYDYKELEEMMIYKGAK